MVVVELAPVAMPCTVVHNSVAQTRVLVLLLAAATLTRAHMRRSAGSLCGEGRADGHTLLHMRSEGGAPSDRL